ncbi:sulfite exporter TauE/SafE family protein [Mycolicibacterium moriokaense]|uniref:Probable membrane transporter protein n=1 Tax=Mycolicibacterium moriokaense TaxID=39691 RepID=A0A318HER0_9MYCO|nr:sulfite exporter TauE/SafE family protein [Mycolicibacterium moriokaense]PXX07267.1 hypothetical protein C8E89_11151 [Mycolicibacterium moriokaense]
MTVAIALALGAVIGVVLGLLGGGGSILAVPALVYGVGLDLQQAIPVSLVVIGIAAAVGAVPKLRARQVEWRLSAVFSAAGIPATFVGGAVGRLLPDTVLMIGFAAVMVVAGIRMLADPGNGGTACKTGNSGINWRRCAAFSIPAGFAVGLLTGLFGIGGGFLIIPALVVLLGVDMPIAVGTSLIIIMVNSAAGLISHLGVAPIDWTITAAFASAATLGALIAGYVGTRLDTGRLRRWFAYLIVAVAVYVLFDTAVLH